MYYSKRCFLKKKQNSQSGNALTQGWQIQVLPLFPTYTHGRHQKSIMTPFPIKPRCSFEILLNIVLLVTISNIFKLEHKMNPICQPCLRPEKNVTLMVGLSPDTLPLRGGVEA